MLSKNVHCLKTLTLSSAWHDELSIKPVVRSLLIQQIEGYIAHGMPQCNRCWRLDSHYRFRLSFDQLL